MIARRRSRPPSRRGNFIRGSASASEDTARWFDVPLLQTGSGLIVNNETLELLSETGVIGLAAFLLFLIVLFRENTDHHADDAEPIRTACIAALLGMLAQYQTFSTLYIMHVWFTIGLLLASSKPSRA